MKTKTLYPNKTSYWVIFIFTFAAAIAGILALQDPVGNDYSHVIAWQMAILGGATAFFVFFKLLPLSYIKLYPDRIQISTLFNTRTIQWKQIRKFYFSQVFSMEVITFDLVNPSNKEQLVTPPILRVEGYDGQLPKFYNQNENDLVQELNSYLS